MTYSSAVCVANTTNLPSCMVTRRAADSTNPPGLWKNVIAREWLDVSAVGAQSFRKHGCDPLLFKKDPRVLKVFYPKPGYRPSAKV